MKVNIHYKIHEFYKGEVLEDYPNKNDRVYGAIDLGSNNCRLLLATPNHNSFTILDSFSRIVRLGEGVHNTGKLSDIAMSRAIEALKVCRTKLSKYNVSRFRGVVTAACREAKNCDLFLNRVFLEAGIKLNVVRDAEEAFLAFEACTPLLSDSVSNALLCDIGGCSTELIWIELEKNRGPRVVRWISLPLGVVTLAECYGGDVIGVVTYRKMLNEANVHISSFIDGLEVNHQSICNNIQVIGASGTVTTLTSLHLNLQRYERDLVDGFQLSISDITVQTERLLAMNLRGREEMPCVGRGRGDVIVAGCAILEAITRNLPVGVISVADRGLREGILLALMREDKVLL